MESRGRGLLKQRERIRAPFGPFRSLEGVHGARRLSCGLGAFLVRDDHRQAPAPCSGFPRSVEGVLIGARLGDASLGT